MAEHVTVETPKCPFCRKGGTVQVPKAGWEAWQRGEFIQRAFPDLTSDQRELLMTGSHPACWDEMWKEEDE